RVDHDDGESGREIVVEGSAVADNTATEPPATATGSLMLNAVPRPTALSTRIRPRCASMMSRHIDSPKPVPPLPLASGPDFVEKNGSKILCNTSGGMPVP